jgi:glutathione S-transferase
MLSGLKILFKHAALAPSGAHHQVSFYRQSQIMCLKLLGVPQSMCSLRVIIVAKALNIPLEVQLIDVSKGAHKSPEYISKYQPFGRIPVLLDGDFSLFESRAICRYLINKYQTKDTIQLIPTDPGEAALVEQFISVESSEFFDSVIKYIADVFKKNKGSISDPEQTALFRKNSETTLDVYNNILEGKNYLVGDSFTLADLVHLPYSRFSVQAGLDDVFNSPSRPNVTRWFNNITSEPSWKAALGDL